jgi:hypothetical protein
MRTTYLALWLATAHGRRRLPALIACGSIR